MNTFENQEQEYNFKNHLEAITNIKTLDKYAYFNDMILNDKKINNQQKEYLQDKLINFATEKISLFMENIDVYEWRDSSSIDDNKQLFEDIKNNNLESYYDYLLDMIVDDEYEETYNEIIDFMEKQLKNPMYSKVNNNSKGIKIKNLKDTFYVIDSNEYNGKKLFLLESEKYGDEVAGIIIDEDRNVIMDEIWNGFDDYIENLDNDKDYIITPIKEFIKDGIIYTGSEISAFHIDRNVGVGFADRSRIYNAIKDFEEANKDFPNLPTAFNSDGTYEDKEILYSTYDKYIAISHRDELQEYEQYFDDYVDYKIDYMLENNFSENLIGIDRYILKLEALAEIYYAKKNGLTEEQIMYMIESANEMQDYHISSTMRTTWKALQDGVTKEQMEIINDKEIGISEREVLFELLSDGGTLEQVETLKGFDYNVLYPMKYGYVNNIINVNQGKAICDNLKKLLNRGIYKNDFQFGMFVEGLIFTLQEEHKTVTEIESTFKEYFNQTEEKNFFNFVKKNGWSDNEKVIEVNIRYINEKIANGWRAYTDVIRFDDLETAMKYVNKTEQVYDWLDNSVPVKEDEIPLSVSVNNEIVWENEVFVNQLINKIKNDDIPKNKVTENILTLKKTNFINKFDIEVGNEIICADKLLETIYGNDVREYRCYLDDKNREDTCFEFRDRDVDKVFYDNTNIKNYNIKSSKKMEKDIISINQEPTKNTITNMLQVIGEYEKLNEIPTDKRITSWFGDYSVYEAKCDIQKNDIIKRYIELEKEIRNTIALPFCYNYHYEYYDLMSTQLSEDNYINLITSEKNIDVLDYIDDNNLKEYSINEFYKPLRENTPVVCVNINKVERYIEVAKKDIEKIRANKDYSEKEKKENVKSTDKMLVNKEHSR